MSKNPILLFAIVIIMTLCLAYRCYASGSSFNPEWGIGIICSIDNLYESEIIGFPDIDIDVYDSPKGKKIGTIGKNPLIKKNTYQTLLLKTFNSKEIDIDEHSNDLIEITYEGKVLKYYKEDSDCVNILIHTTSGGVWVRISDLEKNKFKSQCWMDFMLVIKEFWYDNDIDLKKRPDYSSKTIVRIKGDYFNIIFTGKTMGSWAEVEAWKYMKAEDVGAENGRVIKKYKGWIRAIDKKGSPAIWFYTRGC